MVMSSFAPGVLLTSLRTVPRVDSEMATWFSFM